MRLDSERYLGGIPDPQNSLQMQEMAKGAALNVRLAEVFFRAAGLATQRMFADWAGLTQRDAKAAIQELGLETFQVEGESELFLSTARIALEASDNVAFLPFEDNLVALRGGPRLLVDPQYHDVPVPPWGQTKGASLGMARHSTLRTIVAANQVVGFWEFNPDSREIETFCFAILTADQKASVTCGARQVTKFLEAELGHGRSFSLDTDKALGQRVRFIQKLSAILK